MTNTSYLNQKLNKRFHTERHTNTNIHLEWFEGVEVEVMWVVMVTHEDPTASIAAEAGDAELLERSRQGGQVLPGSAACLARE